ncbi:MBOAT family O-acyltransferase [Mesorhizobium sangaii]|uniref:Probable alginate O-acetylase AlgI n=1 Tax=Mesorhizobium sangaii TaxID=505389 RepID=A0A841PFU1_9HYPH|nr:MBOAT family protein [Mesorhizobium sangaii]MBB6408809.1 alginate O-acetyltransferase complex protein AlgI [Mesorhizobium sangaii]
MGETDRRTMVFSDQAFLFLYLPITLLLGSLLSRTRLFSPFIFLSSLIFFYWSSGVYVLLLLFSIVLNFAGAIAVGRWHHKIVVTAVVTLNVLVLCYFKYTAFLLGSVGFFGSESLQHFAQTIILPIGISFFTFQGISYVIDVWRGEVKAERNLVVFGAYKAFFPQLIAGPIVRYRDVEKDFHHPDLNADIFAAGAGRFMVGLCKKVLIADSVAGVADASFALAGAEQTFASAWLGAIAYAIQIYFDFSGYSDMAIGLAMMFGIRFKENFNHPYAASTITEFWRRWHMSLSGWFRDYLYIPLGGNRAGPVRTYANLMIVFLATGIWHGAAWTFVLWGAYHGIFLVAERLILAGRAFSSQVVRMIYFFPVVIFGWVLFRANDLSVFASHVRAMLLPLARGAFGLPGSMDLALSPQSKVAMLLACLLIVIQGQVSPLGVVVAGAAGSAARFARLVFVSVAAVICAIYIVPQAFSPFLYFRF